MARRFFRHGVTSLCLALSLSLLSACAAPVTTDAPARTTQAKPPPQMSRPLPPTLVREAPKIDSSCKTSADCAVKNVGNCCGEMPACVNKDSPVDPAAVQSQCAKSGMASICGFRPISACACTAGQCESAQDSRTLGPRPMPVEPAK